MSLVYKHIFVFKMYVSVIVSPTMAQEVLVDRTKTWRVLPNHSYNHSYNVKLANWTVAEVSERDRS